MNFGKGLLTRWLPLLATLTAGGSVGSCITDMRDAAQDGLYSFVTDTTVHMLEDALPLDEGS